MDAPILTKYVNFAIMDMFNEKKKFHMLLRIASVFTSNFSDLFDGSPYFFTKS